MSDENVFSVVMCRVPVGQDDEFILAGLKKRYPDVVRVQRIYGEEDEDVITTRVQVDFQRAAHGGDNIATILRDRQIIFNGGARRIYPISKIPRQFRRKPVVDNRPTSPETLATEEDILNLLQKNEQ